MINHVERIRDKPRILICVILDLCPKTVPIFSSFNGLIRLAQHELLKKVIINSYGDRFYLQDSESIKIVSPEYEFFVKKYLLLYEGSIFLDVGANIGKYTISAAKTVGPNGLVIAIEPDPENFATLIKNIALNNLKNVHALNLAAWNQKDKLKLFIDSEKGGSSTKTNFKLGYFTVQAISLDEIIHKLNIKRVDCVKIDVEGAELEVLQGFIDTMNEYGPSIITEIMESDNKRIDHIRTFAKQQKYGLERIGPDYYLIFPFK